MSNGTNRWSTLMLNALGLLIVGIVGGIVLVCLVIGLIFLYAEIFDPPGMGEYGDPMAGLTTFFYIVGGSFSIGAVLSIAAVIVIRRRRHR